MENTEDLKKYFNSKEYITTIIGKEGEIAPSAIDDSKISTLISLLTDPVNKEFKEETLLTLKKEKGGDVLLLAIASPKVKNDRHKLIAACWESEIDFSRYLSFFILLALADEYLVSLEAITVISNMSGPFDNEVVMEAIKKVKAAQENSTTERGILLNDLVNTLQGLILE